MRRPDADRDHALTGVYFMTPLTGLVPLAAVTAMVVQIIAPERLGREPSAELASNEVATRGARRTGIARGLLGRVVRD